MNTICPNCGCNPQDEPYCMVATHCPKCGYIFKTKDLYMKKQYTLNYTNNCGDTVARDYFDNIEKANRFMDEMIETYKNHNEDKGLILEDENGETIRYYEPEN